MPAKLMSRHWPVESSDQAFPEPYLLTETKDALCTHIMDTMNGAKLTAHQAKALLHRCLRLVELGERIGKNTTH